MIGIVSSIDKLETIKYLFYANQIKIDAYYWWRMNRLQYNGNDINTCCGWSKGDILTMKLDTYDWTLEFFKNNISINLPIKIKTAHNDSIFYPVISLADNLSVYQNIK